METSRRKEKRLHIQHALNGRGEYKVPGTNYRLDGYVEFPKKTAYEFLGGVFHGCPSCYPHDRTKTTQPMTKHSMDELYYLTRKKERELIRLGYNLYPSVNKYGKYPVGHPVIITSDFEDISNYFGVAKVKVLPNRHLFHPVLPYVSNGNLKFPLCKQCADYENQNDCTCTDEERAIVGTWCTPELNLARSKGYAIQKIYEVYHFPEHRTYNPRTGKGGLFDAYVNLFLKLKQEASGFPEECRTEQQKRDYIADYA
ncbi:uncharacterized protein [Mytilus edulis]|uniref:uncharacterized protein n=1 Tax=Mytilus edulis TaxID=6550 RepID=UPI0039F0CA01